MSTQTPAGLGQVGSRTLWGPVSSELTRVWLRLHVAPSSSIQARSSLGQPLCWIRLAHNQLPQQELCWGWSVSPVLPVAFHSGVREVRLRKDKHRSTARVCPLLQAGPCPQGSEGAGGQSRKLGESQRTFHTHVPVCSHVYAPTQAHTQKLYPQGVKSDCLGINSNSTSYYETLG